MKNKSLVTIVVVLVIGLGMWYLGNRTSKTVSESDTASTTSSVDKKVTAVDLGKDITSVLFVCADNKKIGANFKERGVSLALSDGRTLSLPQTISASGARYANSDESFVFWNKGKTAFITEKDKTTYDSCTEGVAEF
jgi:membrane-bound inhibitor of C-type lysozyme